MPLLRLETSVALEPEKKSALLASLGEILARDTGKATSHVMIVIVDRVELSMAGKQCPGAFVDVRGIGGLNGGVNRKLSASVCELLQQKCGIRPGAVYLNFTELQASHWGFNGSTFG